MIVPMKKVSLMIMGDKKSETLKKLRKLGILHIVSAEGSGKKLEELKERMSLLESALFSISEKKNKKINQENADVKKAMAVAEEIAGLEEEKKLCSAELLSLTTELDRLSDWGEIDPEKLKELSEKGVEVYLYEMPKAEYEKLGENVKTLSLQKTKSSVKFLLIKQGAEGEDEIVDSLKSYKFELPSASTSEIRQKIENLNNKIKETEEIIASFSAFGDSIKKAIKVCEKEIEFEIYKTGMSEENLAYEGNGNVSVAYFTGFVEEENIENLKNTAKENSWGLLVEDPTEEDNVPTKLKNNKFVSLIYPLTDFLGTVPGYFEYDISGWFLAFILVFFGIIFGDGGYGIFICAVTAILIAKMKASKKKVPPAFLLIGLFGLSTIVWGTLTCTWFGLSAQQLPQWLQKLSIPFISNVYADKIWYPFWTNGEYGLTTAQNLQIFCFSLALIQLTVAHIKVAARNRKSIKILGDIGSIMQLIGIFYVVLSFVVNAQVFSFSLVLGGIPVGTVALIMVIAGFVMSFVFSNYAGNIVKSILESLKNIVSVLLGVVNVFSDIVSYIRLWAVGLAGAAISATVNELAGPLLGNFMFMILAIVLLVFGHGLNMILNVLSVIVHGIRLNTLEFSSHLDMSWSGHKFKPFEEQIER
ncbi:MAG: ATPase [Ruminococcaceae bacterium]|nr:ATPase [Oscillospiraceae bacterium]